MKSSESLGAQAVGGDAVAWAHGGGGPCAGEGPAGRREGARRARHAGRPRPQRRRAGAAMPGPEPGQTLGQGKVVGVCLGLVRGRCHYVTAIHKTAGCASRDFAGKYMTADARARYCTADIAQGMRTPDTRLKLLHCPSCRRLQQRRHSVHISTCSDLAGMASCPVWRLA